MSVCDDLLLCNFPKCRVKLSGRAWVTACSHIFCDQHGSGEFSRSPAVCPACNSTLSSKLDIVRTELSPSEEHKAMMLSGLRPEIVLDICSRALAFWTYQIYQERLYQEYSYSKAEGHLKQVEKLYTHQIQSKDAEMSAMKGEVNSLKKILEEYKRKYSELSEKLMERNRQYNKLQGMYDGLRLRNMAVANREASSNGERAQPDLFMGNKFPGARTPPLRSCDADFRTQTFFCTSPFDDSGNTAFGSPGNRADPQNMASSRAFKVIRM
ncbi:E3 ubiquitin-protein ligase CCNB1IP1 [Rana temporaria]|uniref:E3 ubiquitin-protein ligase CCNB1IP1 n=1 Tax=Rana temporaria TaxID=8407 RepID=UPI001AACB8CD|nr:E3 ubiquitin-protein ligase CCNB1IP1 [Rana temporaria]XP_040209393.1 E3 ubiquitin-protein ligase CCNB1IP1 [Rana temporaria]